MKTKLLTLLTFIITTVSFLQNITVDGLDYEIFSNDPNEVVLQGGTFTNPFVIPNSVTFENVIYSVTEIDFNAFSDSAALTEVTIPATVTQIYNNAFSNTGLTEVIALGNMPAAIEASSFGDRSVIDLMVPSGSEEDYLNNGWTGFASVNGTVSSFEVGNIIYGISSLSGNTVDVISSTITGSLNIPQTVTFNTTVYTVTGIAGDAFRENSLTSVTIPNTVTSIGNSAFRDNQITSINIPNTVTAIGGSAFRDNQLTTANIPTSLTVLESSVFNGNQLSSIVIPDGIIDIRFSVFNNNNLTNITIPASVTSIDNFAFTSNPLTEVEALGNIPPSIGTATFNEENIDLTVPVGTEAAYEAAGWIGFKSINSISEFEVDNITYRITALSPNQVEVINGTNVPQDLILPNNVSFQEELFMVTGVGNGAFEGLNITSVVLPNNLVTIGVAAFKNNLITEVSLPESLTTIETEAFRVNQIATVIIPQNVTSIAAFAFTDGNPVVTVICEGLVPPSIASSSSASTFANPQNIDLTVPQGTEFNYLRNGWTGFNTINGGAPNTFIGFEVDNITYNRSLSSNIVNLVNTTLTGDITIPSTVNDGTEDYTVTTVGFASLRDKGLTAVTIPASVTLIGNRAFRGNPLTTLVVEATTPPTINSDGNFNDSFTNRQNIDLTVPQGTEFNYLQNGWTGFNTINGEAPITFIQFEVDNITYNRSLTPNINIVNLVNTTLTGDITIPSTVNDGTEDYTVTTIGFASLRDKGLTAVTIPASVTLIGNRAFRGNPLTTLVVEATTPPTINSDGNFNDSFTNRQNIDLTVPQGTELNYLNAGWTGFKSINNNIFEFEVDNITYRITALSPNQVEVINGTNVPQDLILPNNVSFQEELFTVTGVGNGAFEGLNITSVILPNNLITIRGAAFKNNLITEVSLPESLTIIETEAFRVNQISTVIIPQNVTSIAAFAFSGGNPVTTVICEGLVPSSVASSGGANTFANRQNIDLFIPVGTTQDYTDATWTGFKSVTEANKALVLKIYLQGASLNPNTGEENLMRDDLRVAGVLPTTSPYADVATATTTAFDATGNDAIVDWVFVELRDATNSNTIIESASALLQRDGDVVSTDGVSLFEFNATPDDYFIAVKHRNHLGVILEQVKRVSPVATILDFTKTDSPISLGSNSQTDIGLPANILGLWAGDANADGTVRLSGANAEPADIRDTVLNDPGNFFNSIQFAPQGYFNEDVNMNGELRFSGANSEPLFVRDNILGNPGNIFNSLFATINTQIPEN